MAEPSIRELLVFITVVFFTRWLFKLFRSSRDPKSSVPLPPSPKGVPLLGNLFMVRKDMRAVFSRLTAELGGMFSLSIGPQSLVVLSDMDIVNEAYLVQGDAFADRLMPPLLHYAIGHKGSFAFDNGPVWRARRRFGLSAMRDLGMGKRATELRITEEARILCESLENNQAVPFDPRGLVTNAVANVICNISFGTRFDYDDPTLQTLVVKVHEAVSGISFFSIGNALPVLFHSPLYTDIRFLIGYVKDMVQRIVGEHRQTLDENDARDIIDLYIMEIRRQQKAGEKIVFEDERAWRGILDLFLAGTGTTSSTLLWFFVILSKYPDVMTKVQDEIDRVVGDHRPPSMSDQENMPMTVATIMEIQRFRHVAPLSIPRCTNTDVIVKGYRIPKGTAVILNIWELMTSHKYWNEPEKFNPSRFLSADRKKVVKPEAFVPFGIGNRVCLGQLLAKMELFLFVTNILQRFTFELAEESRNINLDGICGIALVPEDFKIRFKTR